MLLINFNLYIYLYIYCPCPLNFYKNKVKDQDHNRVTSHMIPLGFHDNFPSLFLPNYNLSLSPLTSSPISLPPLTLKHTVCSPSGMSVCPSAASLKGVCVSVHDRCFCQFYVHTCVKAASSFAQWPVFIDKRGCMSTAGWFRHSSALSKHYGLVLHVLE